MLALFSSLDHPIVENGFSLTLPSVAEQLQSLFPISVHTTALSICRLVRARPHRPFISHEKGIRSTAIRPVIGSVTSFGDLFVSCSAAVDFGGLL
jgi:hypothetical protein